MPSWLPKGAKKEWRRLYPELEALGLLTIVDQASFAAYCIAVDQLERSTKALKPTRSNPTPEVQVTEKGYQTPSGPELMRREAIKTIKSFAAEFGFTPASRSRVQVKPREQKSDLASLLDGDVN
jgi:P27 family predicted phage terminase small subunit